ncbi:hypothetical protein [Enterococcus phage vB_EfaM_Ef2.3]|uniref:Uncharacterized protein n=1 Tax=Enterococcus phage vB_EfaM_Ef2.3 TaxID=2546634 RepID=A0A4D6DUS4_9CAUD|nr:hypothetical protein [Enterococcus phage vB_EfaM_Ef2.3]
MHETALVCVLLLQMFVYLMSYYVTRALQYKKLQAELSPLASYKFTFVLYGISIGSLYLFFNGYYIPIVYTVGAIIGILVCLWFTSD